MVNHSSFSFAETRKQGPWRQYEMKYMYDTHSCTVTTVSSGRLCAILTYTPTQVSLVCFKRQPKLRIYIYHCTQKETQVSNKIHMRPQYMYINLYLRYICEIYFRLALTQKIKLFMNTKLQMRKALP